MTVQSGAEVDPASSRGRLRIQILEVPATVETSASQEVERAEPRGGLAASSGISKFAAPQI